MKIVHYTHVNHPPEVGLSAVLYPVDHPSPYVPNSGMPIYTSPVVALDVSTGIIVTRNTVYVLAGVELMDWMLHE